jgi:non-lysosomal glucosylceramidase
MMGAEDPHNTPDAYRSNWTVAALPAAGQQVSYTTSWNANGNGRDVYAPFTSTGALPDKALDQSHSAGAVAVNVTLKPGQSTIVHFALAWDFPQVGFDGNKTVWMRRYTNFYGAKETAQNNYIPGSYPFNQSFHIADDALAGESTALKDVLAWWKPIATNPAYPQVLRTAGLNELYQTTFNNSFWEGGLVSNSETPTGPRRLGTQLPGTHLFFTIDAGAGATTQDELDVD